MVCDVKNLARDEIVGWIGRNLQMDYKEIIKFSENCSLLDL